MEIDQSLDLKRDTFFDAVFLYAATAMFALTVVLATVQVLVRVLGIQGLTGMYWTEPAARFILIVATYWGAAVASRNDEHIRMNYLLDKLEERYPRARSTLEIIAALCVVVFVLIALRGTTVSTIQNWYTSIGGIGFVTSGVLYLGISIGLAIMLYYEGANLSNRARHVIANVTMETADESTDVAAPDERREFNGGSEGDATGEQPSEDRSDPERTEEGA